MDLSSYFGSKPVVASHDTLHEFQPHPEVADLILARHKEPQTAVPWEKVRLHLGL
jgi:hypothetical protein